MGPCSNPQCFYYDKECTKVLCAVDGNFLGNLYVVDFNRDRPVGAV